MLKALSYFNIFFAVIYFMEYLQNSSYWIVSALICMMVYNWLVLLRVENGKKIPLYWQLAAGGLACGYAFFTAYTTLENLFSAIREEYLDKPLIILCSTSVFFALTILLQLLISGFDEYSKKSD